MPYRADILFHIDETLPDNEILEIEKDLAYRKGVYSACVNPRTSHLMIVDYDPKLVSSAALLSTVQRHGVHAEMIGF